jgi:hypothetical protein
MPSCLFRDFERWGGRALNCRPVAVFLLLTLPAWGAGSHRNPRSPAPLDSGYVFALATANRFLYAWQMGDLETGMVLLSDPVRHSQNPEKLERFFAASSGRSYEIARGKGNRGRYSFPLVLVSTQGSQVRRRLSEIILVNTGKNDWAVDKLP